MTKLEDEAIVFLDEQRMCLSEIKNNVKEITNVVKILTNARNKNKRIFTIGNGGSGSTASHLAADLLKTALIKNNKRFKVISLVDNIPVILAWSNDLDYESIFVEQLKNHLSKDDIVIAFSGSGTSPNILRALEYTKKIGAKCIGFKSDKKTKMDKLCDVCINIPSRDMLTLESQHLMICHCIISIIRKQGIPLFKYE